MRKYYPRHIDTKTFKSLTYHSFDIMISILLADIVSMCTSFNPYEYGVYRDVWVDVSDFRKYLNTDKIRVILYNIDPDKPDDRWSKAIACATYNVKDECPRIYVVNNVFRYLVTTCAKFLIAHELSHILLRHVYRTNYSDGMPGENMVEFQANALASTIFYDDKDYAEAMLTESVWIDMLFDKEHLAQDMGKYKDAEVYALELILRKCFAYREYDRLKKEYNKYHAYLIKKQIFPEILEPDEQ